MSRRLVIGALGLFAGVLALLTGADAGPATSPRPREKTFWSGRSGGYRWRWTSADLAASRAAGGTPLFSARRILARDFDPEGYDEFHRTLRPLSLVGSVMSYRVDDYWSGGAHPSGHMICRSVDVRRPTGAIRITALFPDADVVAALLRDPVVKKALPGTGPRPRTTAELVSRLKGKTFGGEEGFQYEFGDDLLYRFSFHHLRRNQVAVRFGLRWGAEIYRFQTTELGVLLPIPRRLREPLRLAAAGREGFLTNSLRRRFPDQETRLIEYERPAPGK